MIAIIGAMDVEVELLLQSMEIKETKEISSMKFYVGTLFSKEVVLAKCNPGKINSALCAQTLILEFKPSLMINPGVAGGIGENVDIGDLVVANFCCQHDFDISVFGRKLGEIPTDNGYICNFPCDEKYSEIFKNHAEKIYDGKVFSGIVASGDQFIASAEKCTFFNETFGAIACEMESGSIAHACYLNHIPFVALRSISDNANKSGHVDFETFAEKSAHKTAELVKAVFQAEL